MKIVIDMNLSPEWEAVFGAAGHSGIHWSRVGAPNAKDVDILAWAKSNGHVVFTHDLDFGVILAATGWEFPSVLQVRTEDVSPSHLKPLLLRALAQFRKPLEDGVLISIDEHGARARVLPLKKSCE